MRNLLCFSFLLVSILSSFAQDFSRKDSLRGNLNALRTCYDVVFYDLFVIVDEQELSLEKSYNVIHFIAKSEIKILQIDLASNMEVLLIEFEDDTLDFTREYDAVNINFNRVIKDGEKTSFKIWYGGYPKEAVNPPWDGGVTWSIDSEGYPWVGVSCQTNGAHIWFPCKEHPSDKADGAEIIITAPEQLIAVGNGLLISKEKQKDRWTRWHWKTNFPISPYNINFAIGKLY